MFVASVDSLPLDAVVHILCKLNHEELKHVAAVSKLFNKAAHLAQQRHFNFSTPPPTTWVFHREMCSTPQAPLRRESKRKPRRTRLSNDEMQKIAVALFPAEMQMGTGAKIS